MFWKLCHRLFGTHYVAVDYGYSQSVRRVQWTPAGRPYAKCYGDFIWLDGTGTHHWDALTFDKAQWLQSIGSPQKPRAVA